MQVGDVVKVKAQLNIPKYLWNKLGKIQAVAAPGQFWKVLIDGVVTQLFPGELELAQAPTTQALKIGDTVLIKSNGPAHLVGQTGTLTFQGAGYWSVLINGKGVTLYSSEIEFAPSISVNTTPTLVPSPGSFLGFCDACSGFRKHRLRCPKS